MSAVPPRLFCRSRLAECCRRRSRMEGWPLPAQAMTGVPPRLLGKSMLAPNFSSSLTISRWPPAAAACSRVNWICPPSVVGTEQSASTVPPLRSHLTTFCSSPCQADS
eukprot:scaffold84248_cov61-Phaeocystis_antarctica.AAC.3